VGDIYALLVGIDKYRSQSVRNLAGCKTDVADALAFLERRRGEGTAVYAETLLDDQAPGTAIVDGFRRHLGRAGAGDTALFWFSGHGSDEPVPAEFWRLETGGRLQTLVCADSRVDGRPELLDKELALLLDGVAESGCHVVAVLDSCHSGGATRGGDVAVRGTERAGRPPAYRLLPDLVERYAAGPPPVRHVLLAACQPEEKAGEDKIGDAIRGRFSWALLRAMHRAGPETTYRELVTLARNEVERLSATQCPMVFPPGNGPADGRLLGGDVITAPPAITLRCGREGWEVNAGSAHTVDAGTWFAVDGPGPARELRVTRTLAGRSLVEPVDWWPDGDRLYPVVVSRTPRATLVGTKDPPLTASLRAAVGDRDPQVRIVDEADAELILWPVVDGVRLTDRTGSELAVLKAAPTVADLGHIARWWRVKSLANPDSRIAHGVVLEVVEPLPGETVIARQCLAAPPDPDGVLRLSYERGDAGWEPPGRFLRLRNTMNRPLYCVLLDLTERFKIDSELCRFARVPPGETVPAYDGELVEFFLPDDLADTPGVSYRDWLKLIVSTEKIDAAPYEMPALDRSRRDARRRQAPDAPERGDWWTTTLPVVIAGPRTAV
jgi:hypothetical protein